MNDLLRNARLLVEITERILAAVNTDDLTEAEVLLSQRAGIVEQFSIREAEDLPPEVLRLVRESLALDDEIARVLLGLQAQTQRDIAHIQEGRVAFKNYVYNMLPPDGRGGILA